MSGGLMQLVAYGAQDAVLTGRPQITFWKILYRRHSNFAMEEIEQSFNGQVDFGRRVTAVVSRNGDLISKMFLEIDLPALKQDQSNGTETSTYVGWVASVGHALLKEIELQVGGQRIDKHYGHFMEVWDELTQTAEKKDGFGFMIGKYEGTSSYEYSGQTAQKLYIPLQFYCNRHAGLALPLIALQYHEVKLDIQFTPVRELVKSDITLTSVENSAAQTASISNATLWVDYVYLDTEERRRFAQTPHEYLIEQLQFTGTENATASTVQNNKRLNFNHPCKELIWTVADQSNQAVDSLNGNEWFDYSYVSESDNTVLEDPVAQAKLQLNGHDRFKERAGSYFRLVQPYKHHTRIPTKHVYVYSFALRPEDQQPTGSANFSRIDNASLQLTLRANNPASNINIYAINYNVFKVRSGLGGMAYSN